MPAGKIKRWNTRYRLNKHTFLKIIRTRFLISLALMLLSAGYSLGQHPVLLNMIHYDEDRFHFGFVLGVNQANVALRPIGDLTTHNFDSTYIPDILPLPDSAHVLTVQSSPSFGFVVSIIGDVRIGHYMNLRFIPTLAFGDRTLQYTLLTYRKGVATPMSFSKPVPSTYVSFPLEMKFKSKRYNNFRAYVMTGAQYTLDLASQAKKREQKNADQKIVKFMANDVYAELGVGFDFYNEYFKFAVELKMMYGLMDVLKREHNLYTDSIESLKSKIFQLSFTFE
jgi:hypothetical protein